MKEKSIKRKNCFHVISQPGDLTRYDYAFARSGSDKFCFMPVGNNIVYPQFLYWQDVKEISEVNQILITMAKKIRVNPYTLLECIRTMRMVIEDGVLEDGNEYHGNPFRKEKKKQEEK